MSSPFCEIPWETLCRITETWSGKPGDLAIACPLPGGFVNTTLKLTTRDGSHAVLKITPHLVDKSYEAEAFQLDHLRSLGLPTPRVIAQHTGTLEDPCSYLLMEFVSGVDLASARARCDSAAYAALQASFGELVATLHRTTADAYGPLHLGARPMIAHWPTFFHEVFDPIFAAADGCGLLSNQQRKWAARIHDRLDRLLDHGDVPRLVHWDIWSSNVLAEPIDGSDRWRIAAILDPGCKFAHAEAELAYIELFRTGNRAFSEAYRRTHSIDEEYYAVRKQVYQLYFLLNHLRLFGVEYQPRTAATLERVASLV